MHGLWSRRDLLAIETASLFFSDANNYGDPRPSELDVTIAKTTDKMVYVGSRDGLYSVDPDGNVRHVFSKINWFDKRSKAKRDKSNGKLKPTIRSPFRTAFQKT